MNGILKQTLETDGTLNAVATGTVADFVSGQGYVDQGVGAVALPLMVTEAVDVSDSWVGGFRYRADGALRVVDATLGLPADSRAHAGVMFSPDGQLCYTSDVVDVDDVVRVDGVAVTNAGIVYIALV